jgi:hypothetical protein
MQDVFDDNAREAENPVVVSEAQILEYGLQTLKKTPNRKHDGRDIRWQIVSEHRSLVLMDQKGIKFKRDIECFSEARGRRAYVSSTGVSGLCRQQQKRRFESANR